MNRKAILIMCVMCFATAVFGVETKINLLPKYKAITSEKDWLIDGSLYKADIYRSDDDENIIISNGLIRRVFKVGSNCGTIGFDNLMTGDSILRALSPEAEVVLDVQVIMSAASRNRKVLTEPT